MSKQHERCPLVVEAMWGSGDLHRDLPLATTDLLRAHEDHPMTA
jgi:hypothetical protein